MILKGSPSLPFRIGVEMAAELNKEYWRGHRVKVMRTDHRYFGSEGVVVGFVGNELSLLEDLGTRFLISADCCVRISPPTQTAAIPIYDQVNKPAHYAADRKYEPIDVIEDWFPASSGGSYHKGNALKYMSRAGRKIYPGNTPEGSEITDLEKSVWYLQRRIANLRTSLEKDAETVTHHSV